MGKFIRISNLFGIGTGHSAAKRAEEEAQRQAAAAAAQSKEIVDWERGIAERGIDMAEQQWALTRPLVRQQVASQLQGISQLSDFQKRAAQPVSEISRGRPLQRDQRMVQRSQYAAQQPFAQRARSIQQSGGSAAARQSAMRGNEILAAQAASKSGAGTQRLLDDFLLQQAVGDREAMYAQRMANRDIPYSRELNVLSALAGIPVMPDTASSSMAQLGSMGGQMISGLQGAAGLYGASADRARAAVGLNPGLVALLEGVGSEKIASGMSKLGRHLAGAFGG